MSKPTALIVEDKDQFADAVRALLEEFGLEVHIANGESEIPPLLRRVNPDLVVLGGTSSEADTLTILRLVRWASTLASLQILAIVPDANAEGAAKAMSSGADACLLKPLTQEELRDAIRENVPVITSRRSK